ncbi:MAG: O-antigen ligase family protein [Bacteroidota bacterium]
MIASFFHSYRQQALFFCLTWMVSLLISAEFITSVSMIALLILALLEWQREGTVSRLRWRPALKENLALLVKEKAWLIISVPFFLVLCSALYSTDIDYLLERLRIKLPFLVLPFAFLSMPSLGKRDYFGVLYFFLLLLFVSSVFVGINYVMDFEAINIAISKGQQVPTPINHIRFSLMLAFAILVGGNLWRQGYYWRYAWERPLLGILTVLLFGFIHILSVRSGLFVLYFSLVFLCVRYWLLAGKWLWTLGAFSLMLVLPLIMYKTIPSFTNKVNYSLYDLDMYRRGGRVSGLSDSERIVSLLVGLEIGNQHPILGVGAGDLRQAVREIYGERHEGMMVKMPHNQLVSVYAGTGILGLMVFLLAFFWPLFHQRNYQDPIFTSFHLMVFFSFMVENTIENAVGVAFYTLFLLLGMAYLRSMQGRQDQTD